MLQRSLPGGYKTEHIWRPLLKLKKQEEQSGKPIPAYAPFGDWENSLIIAAFIRIDIRDFGSQQLG